MRISVPATSANLGPGFDCLGVALNLKNQVIIRPSKFHSVSLKGEGSNNPALKDNNMFISIFNDFYYNLTQKKRHFRFEFFNEIPLSRGLGSSSAVIVSAIASAYAIEGIKVEKERLLNLSLAYESHPDNITPAVMGGFNVASVHENEVKFINKSIPKHLKAVVVIPNRPISTQLSRKALPFKYSKEDIRDGISQIIASPISSGNLLSALCSRDDVEQLGDILGADASHLSPIRPDLQGKGNARHGDVGRKLQCRILERGFAPSDPQRRSDRIGRSG